MSSATVTAVIIVCIPLASGRADLLIWVYCAPNFVGSVAETKDPSRVQPHLKKCFEGVDKLRFDGPNSDITGVRPGNNVTDHVL